MIYTSYFGNWRNFPKDMEIVSIARVPPKGFKGRTYDRLAPSPQLLEQYKTKLIDSTFFTKVFNSYLATLNKTDILNELGDNVILCCYEKKGDFCHRNLVGSWLGISEL